MVLYGICIDRFKIFYPLYFSEAVYKWAIWNCTFYLKEHKDFSFKCLANINKQVLAYANTHTSNKTRFCHNCYLLRMTSTTKNLLSSNIKRFFSESKTESTLNKRSRGHLAPEASISTKTALYMYYQIQNIWPI